MTSFFSFGKKKVVPAAATVATIPPLSTRIQLPTTIPSAALENFAAPSAKAVAVEKPGHVGPVRRTLGDLTNARTQIQQPTGKPGAVVAQKPVVASLATSSRRPDVGVVLSTIRQSATSTVPIFPTTTTTTTTATTAVQVPTLPQLNGVQQHIAPEAEPMVLDVAASVVSAPTTTTSSAGTTTTTGIQVGEVAVVPMAPPEDIDAFDAEDPLFVSEYVNDIYAYLRQKEVADRVNPSYMSRQRQINDRMRGMLINWIAESHLKLRLLTETLFLAVNIIDRFLERRAVTPQQMQLVGVTALLIASKCEEIFSIDIEDLVVISAQSSTRRDIVFFERTMLASIDWTLTSPSPLHFLRRFSKAAKNDGRMHTLAKYIIELALLDYNMLNHLPSLQAAGACYLARRMLRSPPYWSPTLEFYSGYTEADALPIARQLNALVAFPNHKLLSIRKKYASPKLGSVANIPAVTEPF